MKPKFSIVVPTYNRAHSVRETIDSCLDQDWQDFEIVVVDDGSTDNTLDVLASIEDERLVRVSQENAGPAAARNKGMRTARGEYIAFLDSDDTWYPEFLSSVAEALQHHGDVVVYGQIIVDRGVGRYWVKPERALLSDEALFEYLYVHGGFIQTSTMVIPSALAEQVQWDEDITFGDNDQFAIDLWKTGVGFVMLPNPLTFYADIVSDGALSQLPIHDSKSAKYTNFFTWMETQKDHMSERAWAGFQARFISVSLARRQPLASLRMLLRAKRLGVMSWGGLVRQSVQNFAPRTYRRLVDRYVAMRGLKMDQIRQ